MAETHRRFSGNRAITEPSITLTLTLTLTIRNLNTHRCFSDFVELHESLRRDEPAVVFRLPRDFPLSKVER